MRNCHPIPSACTSRGFTIVELMVAVAMVAIISAIAAPNLRAFIVRAEVRTAVNDWTSALLLARSEAVKQGLQVTLCPSEDGSSCKATTAYEIGWIVGFPDPADSTKLKVVADYLPLPRITMTANKSASAVTYLPNGRPIGNFTGMRVTVMENSADADDNLTRYICIARTGRARVFNDDQYMALSSGQCG